MQNTYIDDGLVYSWVLHYYPATQKRGKLVRVFSVDATTPMFLRAKHTKSYKKTKNRHTIYACVNSKHTEPYILKKPRRQHGKYECVKNN